MPPNMYNVRGEGFLNSYLVNHMAHYFLEGGRGGGICKIVLKKATRVMTFQRACNWKRMFCSSKKHDDKGSDADSE